MSTPQFQDAVREVVERARAGDQVAIAHIARVRDGAKKGDETLKATETAIAAYCKAHPVRTTDSRWGADTSVNTNPRAQQAIWKARECSPEVFAVIVGKTAPFLRTWDLLVAMVHGPLLKRETPLFQTTAIPGSRIGGCAKRACLLQCIAANPKIPISAYCKATGWELGE